MRALITIGIKCDGFSITLPNGKRVDVNQEDDHAEKLSEIFRELGFNIKIKEEY